VKKVVDYVFIPNYLLNKAGRKTIEWNSIWCNSCVGLGEFSSGKKTSLGVIFHLAQ